MKAVMSNTPGPPRTPPLSSLSSLTRQASIYTLTLEELQNAVNEPGKNFGSMNMEEFLKNIWTVEESQAMAAAMSGIVEGNGSSSNNGNAPNLQRQGSLSLLRQGSLSLPQNLTGKTVDEVWREIHRSNDRSVPNNAQQRQVTLAEITLEDFLAKAGLVREETEAEPSGNSSSGSAVTLNAGSMVNKMQADGRQALLDPKGASQATPQQVDWLNYQLRSTVPHQQLLHHQQQLLQQHQHQQQQQAEAAAAFAGRLVAPVPVNIPAATATNILDVPFDAPATLSAGSLSLSSAMTTSSEKKRPFEVEEKSIEQRQKRMIKNRESAARSRARKQAYTVELEEEVTQLKEENAKLRQEQAEATRRRRQELMQALSQSERSAGVLRRSLTSPW